MGLDAARFDGAYIVDDGVPRYYCRSRLDGEIVRARLSADELSTVYGGVTEIVEIAPGDEALLMDALRHPGVQRLMAVFGGSLVAVGRPGTDPYTPWGDG